MTDLFKPTFLRMGVPINKARPPTSITPPTQSVGSPTPAEGCSSYDGTSTSHDWTIPPNAVPGDLVIAFLNCEGTVATVPSGWTLLATSTVTGSEGAVYARVLDGSENYNDTWTTTSGGSNDTAAQWVYVKDYAGTVADIDIAIIDGSVSTTNPPAVTASVPGVHIVYTAILGNKGGVNTTAAADVPTNYTLQCYTGFLASSAGNPRVYSARRLVDIATNEDPGAFNYSDGGAGSRVFHLVTLAVPAGDFDPELPLGVTVLDDGTEVGRYKRLDFRSGSGVTVTVTEDGSNTDEANIEIVATGGAGGGWDDVASGANDGSPAAQDEFDNSTWDGTTVDPASPMTTVTERYGQLSIAHPGGDASAELHGYMIAYSPAGNFHVIASISAHSEAPYQANQMIGVMAADGTTHGSGNQVWAGIELPNNRRDLRRHTGYNTQAASSTGTNGELLDSMWIRQGHIVCLEYTSSSGVWKMYDSHDGITWIYTGRTLTHSITVSHVGIMLTTWAGANSIVGTADFIRAYDGLLGDTVLT